MVALLALVVRVEHAERDADPHAARYAAALQRARAQAPRFDATYVTIPAGALGTLGREYAVVDTGVRVERVHVLAHRPGYEAFIRGVRDGRVHNGRLSVV